MWIIRISASKDGNEQNSPVFSCITTPQTQYVRDSSEFKLCANDSVKSVMFGVSYSNQSAGGWCLIILSTFPKWQYLRYSSCSDVIIKTLYETVFPLFLFWMSLFSVDCSFSSPPVSWMRWGLITEEYLEHSSPLTRLRGSLSSKTCHKNHNHRRISIWRLVFKHMV